MKQKKREDVGFFPDKSDKKLLDPSYFYLNRDWPCIMTMVIMQSTEGVAVTDLKGNLRYVNKAFASIHGYNPENLIGKHLSIFHSPDQLSAVRKANKHLMKTGYFAGEIWHRRKNGSVFPTLMQNTILKDKTGKAVGMIGTIQDISSLKQAQNELLESRNQLKKMVEKKNRYLRKVNTKLQRQMKEKEKIERDIQNLSTLLEEQKAIVERKNLALQEIIEEIHREKEQIKQDVMENVDTILIPIMQRLKRGSRGKDKKNFEILEEEIKKITSSFGRRMNDKKLRLTPREIEICDLIRNGLTSKDISRVLGLSKQSVDGHRNRIRKKLGISNKKYNLASVLQHL